MKDKSAWITSLAYAMESMSHKERCEELAKFARNERLDELDKLKEPFKNAIVIYESRFAEYVKDRKDELEYENI